MYQSFLSVTICSCCFGHAFLIPCRENGEEGIQGWTKKESRENLSVERTRENF